jgi:hypothetical protein
MIFLAKDSSSFYNFRQNATADILGQIERLESFTELKKYAKRYEKYNFRGLETYSWWKNPFMFTNSKPEANDGYSQKEREKATVMRSIFEQLGGQGSACWNTESISGNIVALKFYQRLSGCHIELKDFETAFCEVPEVDSSFINTLNQFVKEFSAIMDDTDLAKRTKKIQDFINL